MFDCGVIFLFLFWKSHFPQELTKFPCLVILWTVKYCYVLIDAHNNYRYMSVASCLTVGVIFMFLFWKTHFSQEFTTLPCLIVLWMEKYCYVFYRCSQWLQVHHWGLMLDYVVIFLLLLWKSHFPQELTTLPCLISLWMVKYCYDFDRCSQ